MNPHVPFSFQHMGSPPPPHQPQQSGSPASHHPSLHPGPATSPSQSVPGRRTPLGTVGLGGFYAQGPHSASGTPIHVHTDENRPGGSSTSDRLVSSFVILLLLHFLTTKKHTLIIGHLAPIPPIMRPVTTHPAVVAALPVRWDQVAAA